MVHAPESPAPVSNPLPAWPKPLTISEIVSQSFKLYGKLFVPIIFLAMLATTDQILAAIFQSPGDSTLRIDNLFYISTLAMHVLDSWVAGVMVVLVSEVLLGGNASFRVALPAFKRLGSLAVARLCFLVLIGFPAFVAGILVVLLHVGLKASPSVFFLLIVVGAFVAIPVYIYLLAGAFFFHQTILLEGFRLNKSFGRSSELLGGKTPPEVLLCLLVGFASVAIPSILGCSAVFAKLGLFAANALPSWAINTGKISSLVFLTVAIPFSHILTTVCYFNLRVRKTIVDKESPNLELAAQLPSTTTENPTH